MVKKRLMSKTSVIKLWFVSSLMLIYALDFMIYYGYRRCEYLMSMGYEAYMAHRVILMLPIHSLLATIFLLVELIMYYTENIYSLEFSCKVFNVFWVMMLCVSITSVIYFNHFNIDEFGFIFLTDLLIWIVSLAHIMLLHKTVLKNKW